MAPKVIRWSDAALLDIDDVCAYVSQKKPENAAIMADKIEKAVQSLLDDPYIGRKIPEYNQEHLRERVVDGFRILYRITPEIIEIAAIFSGRNKLPKTI
jgi:plasmid stabilization system protein ParE